jgi:FKBP-type peptidyl-prolyl cis-trans isomerase
MSRRYHRLLTERPLALAALAALLATTAACDGGKEKEADQSVQPAADPRQKRPPIEPPRDVSAPPADAQKTASGLAYVILAEGGQARKPGINDTVRIHYTAWTVGGETRFSTRHRNRPQGRYLPQQPPGWVETLTAMNLGEKRLVWMPPDAAYAGRGAKPTETIVYEIELMEIEPAPATPQNLTAPPANAQKTASGIPYEEIAPATGTARPRAWDQVSMHYTAWDANGKMLQTTHTRPRPQVVSLLRAMPGWVDVLENMSVGQKVRAWIPASMLPSLAGLAEDATVVYELELTDIQKQADPPPVPTDVAAPPRNAKKTAKGVFYRVLKPGTGKEHPTMDKLVRVHYTGWTTDGRLFDSSVVRASPARFPLTNVIEGWGDGLQTMVVGETTRFWIPESLAYKGRKGSPAGMLVFDVELLEIIDPPKPPPLPDNHPSLGETPHGAEPGAEPGAPGTTPHGAQQGAPGTTPHGGAGAQPPPGQK